MKHHSNFNLHLYTEMVFGKGVESQAGELVKKHGGTKALLVYGGGSIKRSGLYERVKDSLNTAGIAAVELAGVHANPRRSHVNLGIEIAEAEKVDFIFAIGGGSAIDTAKAIGFAMKFDGDWWDLYCGKARAVQSVPVGVILTITAAGSETSVGSVIVDDIDTYTKKSIGSPAGRPVFAILNPELTYSVNPYQTGAGSTDALAHTLERYFCPDDCALADEFGAGLMRNVVKYGPIAYREPENYEARAELMLAGTFSHNDLTGIGHAGQRGGPHNLERHISGTFDTTHAAGLAAIMPAWLKLVVDTGEVECARVAKFAIEVFGVTPDLADLKAVAYEGIERFKCWLRQNGMPLTLRELGIKEEDLKIIVEKTPLSADGYVEGYVRIHNNKLSDFYRSIF